MNSYTRHRRRSWQQLAVRITCAVVIGGDAVWTIRADNGVRLLASLAFGLTAAVLATGACSWAVSTAWHRGRQRYLVHAAAYTPLRRPLYPIASGLQSEPSADPGLHYAINADHWRHDPPPEPAPVSGPRPYLRSTPDPEDATVGAAR